MGRGREEREKLSLRGAVKIGAPGGAGAGMGSAAVGSGTASMGNPCRPVGRRLPRLAASPPNFPIFKLPAQVPSPTCSPPAPLSARFWGVLGPTRSP